MRTKISLALLGFFIGLSLTPAAQAQLAPVTTCGQTLGASGEYVLMNDLNCAPATGDVIGVQITASDVVFHLAGHTISSSVCDVNRNVSGIFVVGGLTNVRIDGGNVSGFNDGVLLSSSNSSVFGMNVTGACFFGIHVQGANNRVEDNKVTASGDGVLLLSSTGSIVRCNYLSGNARAGAAISGENSSNNIIEENIISNNGSAGGFGVAIFNGSNNVVRDNAVNHNPNGILIASPNNRVRGNTVSGSTNVGISINLIGAPSIVRRNTVLGSGNVDMSDDSAICDGNIWRNNTFQTDQVAGAPDGGPNVGCIR